MDSSVLIAAVSPWHSENVSTVAAVNRALSSRKGVVVPAHAFLEAYSVMTRMPPPHRLTGRQVMNVLRGTFSSASLAPFPADRLWELLDELAANDLAGGITYDAAILAAAESAGATSLLTWNTRHFELLAPTILIETP